MIFNTTYKLVPGSIQPNTGYLICDFSKYHLIHLFFKIKLKLKINILKNK
jgi:hypothetical protein